MKLIYISELATPRATSYIRQIDIEYSITTLDVNQVRVSAQYHRVQVQVKSHIRR